MGEQGLQEVANRHLPAERPRDAGSVMWRA
jgi:hypothetical protein